MQLFCCAYVSALCCIGLQVDVGPSASEELLEFAIESTEANRRDCKTISGVGEFTYVRAGNIGHTGNANSLFKEQRRVRWFVSATQRRIDQESMELPEGVERFGLPRLERRVLLDTEQLIYYPPYPNQVHEAYISPARPSWAIFPRGICGLFDPLVFFKVGDHYLRDWIDNLREEGYQIHAVQIDGNIVIRAEHKDGKAHHCVEFVCPRNVGYNVSLMTRRSAGWDSQPYEVVKIAYHRVATDRGLYFPKRYDVEFMWGPNQGTETVAVEFDEIRINEPIDDSVFTFAGMGVPLGTRLIDRREAEPIFLSYGFSDVDILDEFAQEVHGWSATSAAPIASDSDMHVFVALALILVLLVLCVVIVKMRLRGRQGL